MRAPAATPSIFVFAGIHVLLGLAPHRASVVVRHRATEEHGNSDSRVKPTENDEIVLGLANGPAAIDVLR